jgi:tetratricopeptide (TPR) repeat protein
MRNAGLEYAHKMGADWAVMLDTDERINLNGTDIRGTLERCECDVIIAMDRERFYKKERFYRMPFASRFTGAVHEHADWSGKSIGEIESVTFSELDKDEESKRKRDQWIIDEKKKELALDPENGKTMFYIANSYDALGEHESALEYYDQAIRFGKHSHDKAWSCFRAALTCREMDEPRRGLRYCLDGLGHNADYAELAWLAGVLYLGLGEPDQAIYWSRMAIANGRIETAPMFGTRPVYQFTPGLYEGPYETIALAYKVLLDAEKYEEYMDKFRKAKEVRG